MRFIITGGGTGGHIFSAIATAKALKKLEPKSTFLFIGANDYMEMDIIPKYGYDIIGMDVHRMNRFERWKNWKMPFEIIKSLYQSYKIIKKFNPDAIIGTGGFATGPVIFAGQYMGKPSFVQEHNAYPGITNQLLSRKATRIHTAYKNVTKYLPKNKVLITGNPVREEFYKEKPTKKEVISSFSLNADNSVILMIGGSRGAKAMNEAISRIIPELTKNNTQLIFQTGKIYYNQYKHLASNKIIVTPFIDNMLHAYAASDIIITRSGAMSTTEIALMGKPAIIVPDPFFEQDHQTHNAEEIANSEAAVYIKQNNLNKELLPAINKIIEDKTYRENLQKNIKKFSFPNAAHDIATDILTYLKQKSIK
jgi:UDP-N-acetylglucosamine--N-acetylmuramyl-(pentapeptide) pyrophosphoryl-undecaprenol N-acetylglucosamine transferase